MLDLGISKMALIGAVALIVIGPEKLPRVARTAGALLGRAQRYVADVKSEVNRAIELEELKKMKESVEQAGREVEQSIHKAQAEMDAQWRSTKAALQGPQEAGNAPAAGSSGDGSRRARACGGKCNRARRAWCATARKSGDAPGDSVARFSRTSRQSKPIQEAALMPPSLS